jgi:hypothetical protein
MVNEQSKPLADFEQKGYDAWMALWLQYGYAPNATLCPARWMQEGSPERAAFITGWSRAKREYQE